MKRLINLLALIVSVNLSAQQLQPPNTTQLVISSKVMAEDRVVLVRTPAAYNRGETRYPVLYLTDGDRQIANTVASIEFLAREGRIPEMIVVGITNTDRTRDLTPTHLEVQDFEGQQFRAPTSGGADRFLSFIETELIPKIEGEYRTIPYRVFAGHSFGGLFAIHSLFSRPQLFNARIAVSPTFLWDRSYVNRRMVEFLRSNKDFKGTLFFTTGAEGAANKREFETLRKSLSRQKLNGFRWGALELLDEDHGSVVLPSHYYGLRKAFEGWRLVLPANVDATELYDLARNHYAKLSDRVGFKVAVPEASANQIGYRLVGLGKFEEAIAIFKANAAAYPASANVYDSLGEAYERTGNLELARQNYARAIEAAAPTTDSNSGIFRTNFDRVSKALGK